VSAEDAGYPTALEARKFYPLVEDEAAGARAPVPVVDGSGDECLHTHRFFMPIDVPREAAGYFRRNPPDNSTRWTAMLAAAVAERQADSRDPT